MLIFWFSRWLIKPKESEMKLVFLINFEKCSLCFFFCVKSIGANYRQNL